MSKYDVDVDADLAEFEVTVPLVRTDANGRRHLRDVVLRIPSADHESAKAAASEIAWTVVENLPKGDNNNRLGWKLATYGESAEPVKEQS